MLHPQSRRSERRRRNARAYARTDCELKRQEESVWSARLRHYSTAHRATRIQLRQKWSDKEDHRIVKREREEKQSGKPTFSMKDGLAMVSIASLMILQSAAAAIALIAGALRVVAPRSKL